MVTGRISRSIPAEERKEAWTCCLSCTTITTHNIVLERESLGGNHYATEINHIVRLLFLNLNVRNDHMWSNTRRTREKTRPDLD